MGPAAAAAVSELLAALGDHDASVRSQAAEALSAKMALDDAEAWGAAGEKAAKQAEKACEKAAKRQCAKYRWRHEAVRS